MSKQSIETRVAIIEAAVRAQGKEDEKRFEQMESLDKKLDKIDNELSRYRGFVGGILLIATALVTFFKLFSENIIGFFSK